jgi:chromosome segregation ATPase
VGNAEIEVPGAVPPEAEAWVAADPDAATYQFVVRAIPSDEAHQIGALREVLADARAELERLRPLQEGLAALEKEVASAREELGMAERSYKQLQRRLIAERTAFGDHVHELRRLFEAREQELASLTEELSWRKETMAQQQEAIEWRKGVMEDQAARIERVETSRLFRYTAPARRFIKKLRRRS